MAFPPSVGLVSFGARTISSLELSDLNGRQVIEELKHRDSELSLQAMELDLSLVPSILNFVQGVKTWLETSDPPHSLDLLINNAGILAASQRYSPDGFD